MRSNPRDYEMVTAGSLQATVALLANEPGTWLPIAGGTDVMVQYAAGALPARKLVSIWNLPELRRIDVTPEEIRIGAGCTYTDIRRHEIIGRELPLLSTAARWTGGIANQNRGTIGGNIVNASPAADSLPPLLVYEAELILASVRGERRVPYVDFHTGYKQTLLAKDELIQTVCLPRRYAGYLSHARKVGARNAQAISKVCIAALARIASGGVIEDVRIALGSIAPVPLRLRQTEQAIKARSIDSALLALAQKTAIAEVRPIDDIRSTARYRQAVAGNLVVEFLNRLGVRPGAQHEQKNDTLSRWNRLPIDEATREILPCCGSHAWARGMAARRPLADGSALLAASNEIWRRLEPSDWMEAFHSHPRIGETRVERPPTRTPSAQSVAWSSQEQSDVANADASAKRALADANREYEQRFGRIFIVCATGKSAREILEILQRRLKNDPRTELLEAAEQQRQITELRLKKWIQG